MKGQSMSAVRPSPPSLTEVPVPVTSRPPATPANDRHRLVLHVSKAKEKNRLPDGLALSPAGGRVQVF